MLNTGYGTRPISVSFRDPRIFSYTMPLYITVCQLLSEYRFRALEPLYPKIYRFSQVARPARPCFQARHPYARLNVIDRSPAQIMRLGVNPSIFLIQCRNAWNHWARSLDNLLLQTDPISILCKGSDVPFGEFLTGWGKSNPSR